MDICRRMCEHSGDVSSLKGCTGMRCAACSKWCPHPGPLQRLLSRSRQCQLLLRLLLLLYVCCCSGALERNLAPLVATDIVPDAQPRPVAVAVSGVAFPHPEKVSN